MDLIALMALIVALGILLLKIYNLLHNGSFYDKKLIFITFILMLFCWVLFFTAFMFQANALETVTRGATTWTIENNDYLELSFYFNVINFAVLVGFFLSIAEFLTLFNTIVKPRQRAELMAKGR